MKKRITRCLALLLAVVMVLSVMPVAMAEETTQTTWTKTTLSDIKEADTIAITMTKGNDTWVLPNNNGTKGAPAAITGTVSGNTMTTTEKDILSWNIKKGTDSFQIFSAVENTKYLYSQSTNNGIRVGTGENADWIVDDETGYLKNVGLTRYMGVFSSQDWRSYTSLHANIAGQTLNFWKLDAATEQVAPPTATPAAGKVDKGTTVTFSCKTEGAKILIATDGKTFAEGTEATVNEDVTFTVKATKDGMVPSGEVKFAYTVKAEEPVQSLFKDGEQIVIYNPANMKALSTEYTGFYNKGTDVTLTNGTLTGYTEADVWTVGVNADGSYTFYTKDGRSCPWLRSIPAPRWTT